MSGTRPALSTVQGRILEVIATHVEEHGYPPSMRELGAAVGLTSSSSVAYQLGQLEQGGYLRRDPNKPRALTVVPTGEPETGSLAQVLRAAGIHLESNHPRVTRCPADGEDMLIVGLPRIAYTFETCTCGEPGYPHLVEQLWHRTCLTEDKP